MLSAIKTSTELLLLFYPGIPRVIKRSRRLLKSYQLSASLCEKWAFVI
jgi:hypothetical protein